ncbi:MAG: hypothetical protein DLM60_00455 [Pseudonocardiales bacterium]|nr:hypothetical protein [Actinomycetota bacterium]PZS24382.1 MAG: hypothetical protein DLM60_00455 [Pseudonocardiales bacterium]
MIPASRDLASWWADAATHATAAAVAGNSVLPARLALADPGAYLDAEDLGFLPRPQTTCTNSLVSPRAWQPPR